VYASDAYVLGSGFDGSFLGVRVNTHLPMVAGMVAAAGLPAVPGPTKEEWGGAVVAVVALLVREFFWWLRNRKGA